MATMVQCPNSQCNTVSPIPDKLVGRKVRCKKCSTDFVAAVNGTAPAPAPARSKGKGCLIAAVLVACLALVFVLVVGVAVAGIIYYVTRPQPVKINLDDSGDSAKAPNPAQPSGADNRHGVIEIGSKGIKAAVVELFVNQHNDPDLRVLAKGEANATLVDGFTKTGRFDTGALDDAVNQVRTFHDRMEKGQLKDKDKPAPPAVPTRRIYIVVSSGLLSELDNKPDLLAENRAALASAVRKATGREADFIDVRREVELSIKGIVPKRDQDSALLVDVGSGNTKGGYMERGSLAVFSLTGVVNFRKDIEKRADPKGPQFATQAAAMRRASLEEPLGQQCRRKPGLSGTGQVYLSGGTVWALATLVRPGDVKERFVELSPGDMDTFRNLVVADLAEVPPPPGLNRIDDARTRDEANDEYLKVKKVFGPPDLIAGAEILRALSAELGFTRGGKKLYFARQGQNGWMLAYVQEKGASK